MAETPEGYDPTVGYGGGEPFDGLCPNCGKPMEWIEPPGSFWDCSDCEESVSVSEVEIPPTVEDGYDAPVHVNVDTTVWKPLVFTDDEDVEL